MMFLISTLFLLGCGGIKTKSSQGPKHLLKAPTTLADIPTFCKDPSGKFKPIKHILSKGGYNQKPKPYQPISDPKGFIVSDFNYDKIFDLVFIERFQSNIRMITCVSENKRNTRRVTPFIIHETIKPDFQTISESIQIASGKLVLIINKHEHNWGSDTENNFYTYSNQAHDFVLNQRETFSSSGDGMRSDTVEFYNLVNNRYKRSNVCGSMEEGCTSRKTSGRIIPNSVRSTLLKPTKIYSRLVAD